MHGEEPSLAVAQAILNADLVLGLRNKSMAHTNARLAMTENGGRYLSLPTTRSSFSMIQVYKWTTPLNSKMFWLSQTRSRGQSYVLSRKLGLILKWTLPVVLAIVVLDLSKIKRS